MSNADYECLRCGAVAEFDTSMGLEFDGDCDVCKLADELAACQSRWRRLWGRIRIGAVRGAGGSPAR